MYLIYDTETTGLPKNFSAPISDLDNWPRMVQLAWQLHDEQGRLLDFKNRIVKPEGYTIPYNSVKIHGISTEMAHERGLPLKEVLAEFEEAVGKAKYVAGHNIEFDINIVGAEFLRKEMDSELLSREAIDTKDESTDYCAIPGGRGGKFKWPTLSELHQKLFNTGFDEAHNAAADVEATARCFLELCRLGVIKRDDISIDDQIMEHLAEVAKEILSSVDYSTKAATSQKARKNVEGSGQDIDAPFAHLHCHSQYSVLQATSEIKALVRKAKSLEMPAVALTDMGNMFGAFQFLAEAKKQGIKGIVGCEVYLTKDRTVQRFTKDNPDRRYPQVLLAKNKNGYHNLAKISSMAFTEGYYAGYPRADKELLLKYKEDVIATSGGISSEIGHLILNVGEDQAEEAICWWKEHFQDNFYLELNRHGLEEEEVVNQFLVRMAEKHSIRYFAANNLFYLDQDDANAHDILLCVKDGELQKTPIGKGRGFRYGMPNDQYYFKSSDEMKSIFSDLPEAFDTIGDIIGQCEEFTLDRDVLLPKFDIPKEFQHAEDETDGGKRGENAYLRHLTYEGAKRRYEEITGDIAERLDFELATIERTGYPGYFLIVQDFTGAARDMGVSVGPGRGSAAGSAVAYCIGITNVDPIAYDLLFERFLNPDRISMPDIDIDFDDEGRGRVIDWVIEKYGSNQVAQIITYGTMAAKSSIRDTARVLDLPLFEADRLAKLVLDLKLNKLFGMDDSQLKEKLNADQLAMGKELISIANGSDLQAQTVNKAKVLEGSVRNTGTHACGVIITPDDITNFIPVSIAKDSDLYVTQFDNSVVENAGLLKMDFLGLKTLTLIKDTIRIIKERHNIDIDPDEIPLDDPKTYELFQRGETVGIFQFESPGMQKHLKALKPDKFGDLIAMNALYRPGPLEYIPNFIARKHGDEPITYDSPQMEEYLAETYGITVYQEQVMLLSQKLAGFTKGMADALRKGMGKKKKEILDELKPKFFEGCEGNGIGNEVANKIWTDWEAFAAYAFNKSHSTCYSVVAFHTAYLKAHYPAEYMASVLSNNMNDIKQVTFFMEECRRMGVKVLGPDVNESALKFTVNQAGQIRYGLAGVKGVGESAVEAILDERKESGAYDSVFDFSRRINLRSVNKRCFESLAYSGGFDCFTDVVRAQYFAIPPGEKLNAIDKAIKYGNQIKTLAASASQSLFGEASIDDISVPAIAEVEEWPLMEKLNREKEMIGFFISGHPLDSFKYEIIHFCDSKLIELESKLGKQVQVAGIVTTALIRTSKRGNEFAMLALEDYSGEKEIFVFGESYLKFRHFFVPGEILSMKIGVEKDRYDPTRTKLNVLDVCQMSELKNKLSKKLCIEVSLQDLSDSVISEVYGIAAEHSGNSSLSFSVVHASDRLVLPMRSMNMNVDLNNTLLERLSNIESLSINLK